MKLSGHKHFKNLLGNPLNIDGLDTPIEQVFGKLSIQDDPFDMEEYIAAKRTIKCGKSCGDDGITPELLKYTGCNDIELNLSTRLTPTKFFLVNGKPSSSSQHQSLATLQNQTITEAFSLILLVMKLHNQ